MTVDREGEENLAHLDREECQVDLVQQVLAKKDAQVKEALQVCQECMAREALQAHRGSQAIVNIVTMPQQGAHN